VSECEEKIKKFHSPEGGVKGWEKNARESKQMDDGKSQWPVKREKYTGCKGNEWQ
jgi:hypothetical protein